MDSSHVTFYPFLASLFTFIKEKCFHFFIYKIYCPHFRLSFHIYHVSGLFEVCHNRSTIISLTYIIYNINNYSYNILTSIFVFLCLVYRVAGKGSGHVGGSSSLTTDLLSVFIPVLAMANNNMGTGIQIRKVFASNVWCRQYRVAGMGGDHVGGPSSPTTNLRLSLSPSGRRQIITA